MYFEFWLFCDELCSLEGDTNGNGLAQEEAIRHLAFESVDLFIPIPRRTLHTIRVAKQARQLSHRGTTDCDRLGRVHVSVKAKVLVPFWNRTGRIVECSHACSLGVVKE